MNRVLRLTGIVSAATIVLAGCATSSTRVQSRSIAATATAQPYRHAAVAADHPLASQAGLEMLELGGNAVDAAVASSFCLSVVRPYSCGIGGGGFMVIYRPPVGDAGAGEAIVLNYRETSPRAVDRDHYVRLKDRFASRYGVHAVGVPGTVAGLLHALERYGTLDRETVLQPAIRAATLGFAADEHHVGVSKRLGEKLDEHPEMRAAAAYAWEHLALSGTVKVGQRLFNPEQARALELIARYGADAFYRGEIADAIVAVMQERAGPITHDDLAGYEVSIGSPLRGGFHGYEVLAMPPPSSGGLAMLQILGFIERQRTILDGEYLNRPGYVHLVTEAMKHAFADRAEWLADPVFVEVPVDDLLDPAYLDELAARFRPEGVLDAYDYGTVTPAGDDSGTSHLSVIDADGMAVSCTETINLEYGSLVFVPGYGFALNNQMDDFTTIPGVPNAFGLRQSDRNLPEPGKRPLSSMAPTIVLRDGRVELIAGASGGPRIITGTVQAVLNALWFNLPPGTAVATPRFHHQWMPDVLEFESHWTDERTIRDLRSRGHETGRRRDVGIVQMLRVSPDGIRAASDPRKGGVPAGY